MGDRANEGRGAVRGGARQPPPPPADAVGDDDAAGGNAGAADAADDTAADGSAASDRAAGADGATVADGAPVADGPAGADDGVVCQQAVYTCLRGPAGCGYRVIAAGDGLSARQWNQIIRYAPAMDGLCVDSPEAVGTSFFAAGDGRYAVLHTCYAGKEPTGRGGRRTYTRIVVVDRDGLRRFRNNPFALIRAARVAGGLTVDLTADVVLPPLRLSPQSGLVTGAYDWAGGPACGQWMARVVDRLLAGRPVVVATDVDTQRAGELILLTVPMPIRPWISLSAGVTPAVSRPHRLVVLANVSPQVRQRIGATGYELVDAAGDPAGDAPAEHPWARTVGRFILTRRTGALVSMLADRFGPRDVAVLDRIGQLCLALEEAASGDVERVIDAAMPYVGIDAELPLERELARQVVRLARHRFASLIAHAGSRELSGVWQRMTAATPHSPEAARLIEECAALAVTRLCCLDPVGTMRMILETTREETQRGAADVQYARRTASQCVAGWVSAATADELGDAAAVLEAWCGRYPDDADVAGSLEVLHARLAGGADGRCGDEAVEVGAAAG